MRDIRTNCGCDSGWRVPVCSSREDKGEKITLNTAAAGEKLEIGTECFLLAC